MIYKLLNLFNKSFKLINSFSLISLFIIFIFYILLIKAEFINDIISLNIKSNKRVI